MCYLLGSKLKGDRSELEIILKAPKSFDKSVEIEAFLKGTTASLNCEEI
jgi:hypothetical protein